MINRELTNELIHNIAKGDICINYINPDEYDAFSEWFSKNAEIFDEIAELDANILKDRNIGANLCYSNSQYLSYHYGLEYIEGFLNMITIMLMHLIYRGIIHYKGKKIEMFCIFENSFKLAI